MRISRSLLVFMLAGCGGSPGSSPDAAAQVDALGAPDAPGAPDASAGLDFTETYEPGTQDVGGWILTTNTLRARTIETSGGDPGGFLYGEVSTAIPTWATASTRFEPGVDDSFKRDSVFTGDWGAAGVQHLGVDLEVIQAGDWATDRAVTLHLQQWDDATDSLAYDAFFSLPDLPNDTPPSGWQHYDVTIDARAAAVPAGWMCNDGAGTPCAAADWAKLMHQIDDVGFGFWKPGFSYPSLGLWELGIDNVHISATP